MARPIPTTAGVAFLLALVGAALVVAQEHPICRPDMAGGSNTVVIDAGNLANIETCSQLVGTIVFNHPGDVVLPKVIDIAGEIVFASTASGGLTFPSLATVSPHGTHAGDISLGTCDLCTHFSAPLLSRVYGTVSIPEITSGAFDFEADKLIQIDGDLIVVAAGLNFDLSLPELRLVSSISIADGTATTIASINLPGVDHLDNDLEIQTLPDLAWFNMESLISVTGDFIFQATGVAQLSFPALTTAGAQLLVAANPNLASLSFPALVGGVDKNDAAMEIQIQVLDNDVLMSVTFPKLESADRIVMANNPFTTLTLPSLVHVAHSTMDATNTNLLRDLLNNGQIVSLRLQALVRMQVFDLSKFSGNEASDLEYLFLDSLQSIKDNSGTLRPLNVDFTTATAPSQLKTLVLNNLAEVDYVYINQATNLLSLQMDAWVNEFAYTHVTIDRSARVAFACAEDFTADRFSNSIYLFDNPELIEISFQSLVNIRLFRSLRNPRITEIDFPELTMMVNTFESLPKGDEVACPFSFVPEFAANWVTISMPKLVNAYGGILIYEANNLQEMDLGALMFAPFIWIERSEALMHVDLGSLEVVGYGPNEISASQSSEITGLHISNSFRTDDPCTSIDTCDVDHQPPTIDLESMIYASNLVVTTTSIRSLKLYALTNVDQYFLLRDNNGLVEVFVYLLVEVGDFELRDNPIMHTFTATNLIYVHSILDDHLAILTHISKEIVIEGLVDDTPTAQKGSFLVINNDALVVLSLSAFESVAGDIVIINNDALENVALPILESDPTSLPYLLIINNAALEVFNAAHLDGDHYYVVVIANNDALTVADFGDIRANAGLYSHFDNTNLDCDKYLTDQIRFDGGNRIACCGLLDIVDVSPKVVDLFGVGTMELTITGTGFYEDVVSDVSVVLVLEEMGITEVLDIVNHVDSETLIVSVEPSRWPTTGVLLPKLVIRRSLSASQFFVPDPIGSPGVGDAICSRHGVMEAMYDGKFSLVGRCGDLTLGIQTGFWDEEIEACTCISGYYVEPEADNPNNCDGEANMVCFASARDMELNWVSSEFNGRFGTFLFSAPIRGFRIITDFRYGHTVENVPCKANPRKYVDHARCLDMFEVTIDTEKLRLCGVIGYLSSSEPKKENYIVDGVVVRGTTATEAEPVSAAQPSGRSMLQATTARPVVVDGNGNEVTQWIVYNVDFQISYAEDLEQTLTLKPDFQVWTYDTFNLRTVTWMPHVINVGYDDLAITAEHDLEVVMVSQAWNMDDPLDPDDGPGFATLIFATQVRWPYRIDDITVDLAPDYVQFLEPAFQPYNILPYATECTISEGFFCRQYWQLNILPRSVCNIDGRYDFRVVFGCRDQIDEFNGGTGCVTDEGRFSIRNLDSEPICAIKYFDESDSVRATMRVYDRNEFTASNLAESFYLGERAFFEIRVVSTLFPVRSTELLYVLAYPADVATPISTPQLTDLISSTATTYRFSVYLRADQFPQLEITQTKRYTIVAAIGITYDDGSTVRRLVADGQHVAGTRAEVATDLIPSFDLDLTNGVAGDLSGDDGTNANNNALGNTNFGLWPIMGLVLVAVVCLGGLCCFFIVGYTRQGEGKQEDLEGRLAEWYSYEYQDDSKTGYYVETSEEGDKEVVESSGRRRLFGRSKRRGGSGSADGGVDGSVDGSKVTSSVSGSAYQLSTVSGYSDGYSGYSNAGSSYAPVTRSHSSYSSLPSASGSSFDEASRFTFSSINTSASSAGGTTTGASTTASSADFTKTMSST